MLVARTAISIRARRSADLGVAQQQLVEIAKALSQKARILVMDEPTAALSSPEIDALFAIIRRLQRRRRRDRLHLAPAAGDLRDRRSHHGAARRTEGGQLAAGERTIDDLVRLMVGREVSTTYRHRFCEASRAIRFCEVERLTPRTASGGRVWSSRAGEIVGLAGLVGAGRSELARAIFGADRLVSGEVRVAGKRRRMAARASSPRAWAWYRRIGSGRAWRSCDRCRTTLLVAGLRGCFRTAGTGRAATRRAAATDRAAARHARRRRGGWSSSLAAATSRRS